MSGFETYLFYFIFFVYGLFSVMRLFGINGIFTYRIVSFVILLVQGVFIGFRWYSSGHPPIFGTFEETLSASWALIFVSIIVDNKGRFSRFILLFSFLTLLYGLAFNHETAPLVISEQSLWVYFHVLFAWLSYGFYALTFAASVYCLSKSNAGVFDEFIDFLFTKGVLYGFFFQTVYFAIGSYYSSLLHGSWWVWDPVEYLFIISWFIYAIAVHGRMFFGWRKRRVSKWFIAAFIATMVLYWGLIYFPWATYHIFDIEIKVHTM